MKTLLSIFCAVAAVATSAFAKESLWMTDFEAALTRAEKENKPILMNFTGSDFCPPCIMLSKEVFDTPEFKEYAKKNLILMEIDFPKTKPQPYSLKQQNAELARALGVQGFPSIYLVNSKLEIMTPRLGYYPGGPSVWIDGLEKFIEVAE